MDKKESIKKCPIIGFTQQKGTDIEIKKCLKDRCMLYDISSGKCSLKMISKQIELHRRLTVEAPKDDENNY